MWLFAYFQLVFWLDSLLEQSVISVTALYTQAFQMASVATAMNENPNFVALLPVLEVIFLFNFSYQTKVVVYCCFFNLGIIGNLLLFEFSFNY